ncbi:hypothetical protein COP2_033301 [Malus domestica]
MSFPRRTLRLFSVSLVDLLDFLFEAAFGGAAEGQAVQAGAFEDELMETLAAGSGAATEGMAVEEPVVTQVAKE